MSSVIPASRTTWRPPRSRTWSTRADEPARPRDEEPAGLDREAARPAVLRDRRRAGPAARGRTARVAAPARRAAGPAKPPPDVERVEVRQPTAQQPERPRARAGPHRARRRPPRAATRRGGGCRAGRSPRPAAATRSTVARQLRLGHPELRAARARRRARPGSRARRPGSAGTGRRAAAGVAARAAARRASSISASASSADSIASHSERQPVGGRPDGGGEIGVGLADALER